MNYLGSFLLLLSLALLGVVSYIYNQLSYIDWPYVYLAAALLLSGGYLIKKKAK